MKTKGTHKTKPAVKAKKTVIAPSKGRIKPKSKEEECALTEPAMSESLCCCETTCC